MASHVGMDVVTASNAEEFEAAVTRAAGDAGTELYVEFSGAADPATGVSWCPDCVDADPIIHSVLQAKAARGDRVTLIKVPLVRSEYRGVPTHWARVHGKVKLQRIPTLYKWGRSGPVGSLVEEQCKDKELVEELTA